MDGDSVIDFGPLDCLTSFKTTAEKVGLRTTLGMVSKKVIENPGIDPEKTPEVSKKL